MSYTIFKVVYGIPVTQDIRITQDIRNVRSTGIIQTNLEDLGVFKFLYSAAAEFMPGYLGVELCEFNECNDGTDMSSLRLEPTLSEKQRFQQLYDSLPEEIKKVSSKPSVWFIPSSS